MSPSLIPPFYHPTTVALVDDSADFLANASLALDPGLACRLFQSPCAVLEALERVAVAPLSIRQLFSLYRQREDEDEGRHVIDVRLSMIHRQVHNERRFEQLSVLVVDHDMPEMNGLELCRRVSNPLIKKILLTGKVDERVAVQAFNAGLIDRFIRKQDDSAMASLNVAIAEMQVRHFQQMERTLSETLSVGPPRFLSDPAFAAHFALIRERLGIVEYYLTCQPDGMLMLTAAGQPYLLLVQNQERLQAEHEIACDQGAPAELLAALRSGRHVPYFWKTGGYYTPEYRQWQDYLHPAEEFLGREPYLYSVLASPPGFNMKYVEAYGDYLERRDKDQPLPGEGVSLRPSPS